MDDLGNIADGIRERIIGKGAVGLGYYLSMARCFDIRGLGSDTLNTILTREDLRRFFPDSVYDVLVERAKGILGYCEDPREKLNERVKKMASTLRVEQYRWRDHPEAEAYLMNNMGEKRPCEIAKHLGIPTMKVVNKLISIREKRARAARKKK